jgi:hypothetical protein
MASTFHVVYGAAAALAFWTLLGRVVLHRLAAPGLAWPLAPVAGWAIHSVVALPVFFVVPFSATTIALVAGALLVLWSVAARWPRSDRQAEPAVARVPAWTVVGAALLATIVAAAVLPKQLGDAITLSDPIFDHVKAALVDDIARFGLPPGNPFMAGQGRLAYYYLWHFSAAEVARLLGLSGWEADAALTFVSAFMSLVAMMGLAVRVAGRASAAAWVVVFAAASSTRFLLVTLFGEPGLDAWLQNPGGFAGWFFQSAWVPQHLAGTSCVLLAVYLMTRLAAHIDAATIVATGLLVAAGFETSTWVGGVTFALASVAIVPVLMIETEPARRLRLFGALVLVAALALAVASPFVRDQLAASAHRTGASPVALRAFPVLGERIPDSWRGLLDPFAYWLLLLPIELLAIYLPGLAAMRHLTRGDGRSPRRRLVRCYAALTIAALIVAGWCASTLADNNDLAWRAVLLASTGLIVFAAAGMASWIAARRRLVVALVACAIVLALPEAGRLAAGDLTGPARPGMERFTAAPALWETVRRYAGPDERIANNPLSLDRMTNWPTNIGWGLLADRRSCYSTWELTQVYTTLPHDRLRAIDRRFVRVFAGEGTTDDVQALATEYDCRVVVVTPEDGAWTHDPFAGGDVYALVDEKADQWRIYRRRPR